MKKEKIYNHCKPYYEDMFQDIVQAKNSIWIEVYILDEDPVGQKLISLLRKAADKGIDVKLCVDGFGSRAWLRKHKPLNAKENFLLKVYHPLPFYLFERSLANPLLFPQFIELIYKLNKRNHKKLVIIDDRIAYSGSINFTEKSYRQRETGLALTHSLDALKNVFLHTWEKAKYIYKKQDGKENLTKPGTHKYQEIREEYNLYSRYKNYKRVLKYLENVKTKVWLTTPYFVPPWKFIKKLGLLGKQGLDIKLLLPNTLDWKIVLILSRSYYPYLLKRNVKIYEYKPCMLHAKTYIFDNIAIIGSTNLDCRSFFHDLQLDIELKEESSRKYLEQDFKNDLKFAKFIQKTDIKKQSFLFIVLAYVLLLFKNWL